MIIATIGGSGSEHLINRLRQCGWTVGYRPDTVLLPMDKRPYYVTYHQYIRHDDLSDKVRIEALSEFERRAGTALAGETWEDVLHNYFDWVAAQPKYAAVCNRLHMFRYYSRNKIEGVVFHIRDPIQAYLSQCREGRNNADWADVGVGSLASQRMFFDEWRMLAVEAYAFPGSKRIRFEHAMRDTAGSELEDVYCDWDGKLRRSINPVQEQQMKMMLEVAGTYCFHASRTLNSAVR